MSIELLSLFGITLLSLLLFKLDIEKGMKIILLCSVLLHKELFSFYSWNLLPIRFVMLAFSAYATLYFIKNYKKLAALISDPFVLSLGLLFLARLISISNTKNLGASVSLLAFFATACAFVIFTYSVYKDKPDKILEFIKYYINVAFYLCVFGFIQVLVYSRFDFIMGALWNIPGHTPRVGSLFWDTNHFGGFLTGLLPVTGVLFLFAETYKERLKYFIYLVSMSAILLLTSSRTAWIAGFVSLLIFGMLLIYRKLHLRGVLALVFTLFLLTIPLVREYNIKSSPFRAKVKDYFHYRIDSFDSHVLLLKGSVEIFEKYPLIGGGYGGFFEHFSKTEIASEFFGRDPAAFNTRVPPHTIWGELLSETGALGLAAFVAVIGLMLSAMLYASQKLKNAKTYFTVSAMVGAIVGWLTAGIFYSYNNEFFWIILAFYFVYTIGVLGKDFTFSKAVNYVFDSSRSQFFGLFVLGVVVFFTKLGSNHLIPWDEAIYAKIAKNIYQTGDYIFLKWSSSELWLEKPPLYMWLMALSMKIFSITSFAVRLPSALFGLGTVLLTYVFGTKLYGRLAGFFSALVLLTNVSFIYYGRASMLDVTTTFFITASLLFYYLFCSSFFVGLFDRVPIAGTSKSISSEAKILSLILIPLQKLYRALTSTEALMFYAGLCVGLAVMTKGIVGLLPLPIVALHLTYLIAFKKQLYRLRPVIIHFFILIGAAVAVFGPWHFYMFSRLGREFYDVYIQYHVLDRATQAIEDKGQPFHWYLLVMKVSMRIWFIVLFGALSHKILCRLSQNRRVGFIIDALSPKLANLFSIKKFLSIAPSNKDKLLFLISGFIFFFFSASRSKLVWYIIPIYPFLSIIVGSFIAQVIHSFRIGVVARAVIVYSILTLSLFYFYTQRDLVYTYDFTGKQASLMELKNISYGEKEKLYIDASVELPLALYYVDGPFEILEYKPLRQKVADTKYDEDVIFLTKESRYRNFNNENPTLTIVERIDEWVLGYKPSQRSLDRKALKDAQRELTELNEDMGRRTAAGEKISLEQSSRRQELTDLVNNLTLTIDKNGDSN